MKPRCLAPRTPCVLSFSGPDAVRYLNGQLTQDIRDPGGAALPACVTDAKGRLQAFVHVFRGPDEAIWIEAPEDLGGELEARLTRYLIADDVEVANLTGAWQLIHFPEDGAPFEERGFSRKLSRIGTPGIDLWLPAGELPELSPLSPDEAETRRITAGIPAWGAELIAGMLPPEAGLDRTAISYKKGCYIGQEVLSRMKSAGRVNRKLARFRVGSGIAPGDRLAAVAPSSRPAGEITSVAPLPDDAGEFAALGYLDKSAFEARELSLSGKPGKVRVLGFA